jgi:hypothetical protein
MIGGEGRCLLNGLLHPTAEINGYGKPLGRLLSHFFGISIT